MRRRCLALVLSLTRYRKVIITPAEILGLMVPCKTLEPVDTLFLTCTSFGLYHQVPEKRSLQTCHTRLDCHLQRGLPGLWGGTEGVRRGGRPRQQPEGCFESAAAGAQARNFRPVQRRRLVVAVLFRWLMRRRTAVRYS